MIITYAEQLHNFIDLTVYKFTAPIPPLFANLLLLFSDTHVEHHSRQLYLPCVIMVEIEFCLQISFGCAPSNHFQVMVISIAGPPHAPHACMLTCMLVMLSGV